jgi:hypothetical protein
MSIGIQRFIGTICAIAFLFLLVAHVLTFRNVDVFEYVPNLRDLVWMAPLPIFTLFVGTVIFNRELSGPMDSIHEVPKWTLGLGIVLVVYLAWYGVEFGGRCFIAKGCGGLDPSKYLYSLNFANQAFHADRVQATQLDTAKVLFLTGVPALYFLFRKRSIYFGIPGRRD